MLGELDLRAKRDAAVRLIIDRHEEGWRTALTEVLWHGRNEMILAEGLDTAAGVELIIATVKGVSLNPDSAGDVLHQLGLLLVRQPLDGGIFK